MDILAGDYGLDHEFILYKVATLAVQQPRIERLPLGALPDADPDADVDMHVTVIVPPAKALQPNHEVRERLTAIEQAAAQSFRNA